MGVRRGQIWHLMVRFATSVRVRVSIAVCIEVRAGVGLRVREALECAVAMFRVKYGPRSLSRLVACRSGQGQGGGQSLTETPA